MSKQKTFEYKFVNNNILPNFYINLTNENAYEGVINSGNKTLLYGPRKSGKTEISNMWVIKNNAVVFKNNLDNLININKNILIEDLDKILNYENIFHLINHATSYKLKILITTSVSISNLNIKLNDLVSRLKTFNYLEIYSPDDDMLLNILTKLFIDKQFIINSNSIFNYILKRANRSYEDMIKIVEKLDKLSLEKKRQLTIPLIKEIL